MPALNGNVSRKRGEAKMKLESKRRSAIEKTALLNSDDPDARTALIQELIPLGLQAVALELQAEVSDLAGERHSRGSQNLRWGRQNGSVSTSGIRRFRSKCRACVTAPTRKQGFPRT